jgi:hypothetical protein
MESLSLGEIVAHASSLSVVVPLGLYLFKMRKLDRPAHIIGALLVVAAICDITGYLLFKAGQSTAVVFNVYYTLLFFLLCWFYYEIFFKKFRTQIALIIGTAVYSLSFILITFFVQEFFYFQNLIWMIAGIILIIYSIAYFLNSLASIPSIQLFDSSLTWFNSGVLFYFSFSIFLFGMGSFLFSKQDPQVTLLLWSTHNINNIIKNILFTIGLTLVETKTSATKVRSTNARRREPVGIDE